MLTKHTIFSASDINVVNLLIASSTLCSHHKLLSHNFLKQPMQRGSHIIQKMTESFLQMPKYSVHYSVLVFFVSSLTAQRYENYCYHSKVA